MSVPPVLKLTARLLPVVITLLTFGCGGASAATCDVVAAPYGHDSAAGSTSAPLRSAQALIDRLRPGQTGCLRGGDYPGSGRDGFVAYFQHGGKRGKPLTVRGYPGENAVLSGVVAITRRASDVHLSDLSIDDPFPLERTRQVPVQINGARAVLSQVDVTNRRTSVSCVVLGGGGAGRPVGTVIRDSVFHECGAIGNLHDQAIYVQEALRTRIIGNVMRGNAGFGVQLYPNPKRTLIRGNVMVGNGGGVIVAGEGNKATDHSVIERNVIVGSQYRSNLSTFWSGRVGTDNVAQDNCLWDARAPTGISGLLQRSNVTADPLFASLSNNDYTLGSGSGCLRAVDQTIASIARSMPQR